MYYELEDLNFNERSTCCFGNYNVFGNWRYLTDGLVHDESTENYYLH